MLADARPNPGGDVMVDHCIVGPLNGNCFNLSYPVRQHPATGRLGKTGQGGAVTCSYCQQRIQLGQR